MIAMTLQDFDRTLKTVCPQTYEGTAPQGARRFLCWHCYGAQSSYGDNRNVFDLPKVQLDILTQSTTDDLVDEVCQALGAAGLTYAVMDPGTYDPDYNAIRTILQLVVI